MYLNTKHNFLFSTKNETFPVKISWETSNSVVDFKFSENFV